MEDERGPSDERLELDGKTDETQGPSSDFRLRERERPSRTGTPPPLEIPKTDGTPKGQFLHDLYTFMEQIGQPIVKIPHLGYQELDLYRLYQIVIQRGGMDQVTRRQEWKAVYQELGIPTMSTSASYNTRTNYKKHLYLYELEHCDFNDRRPPGMEPKFALGDHVRIISSNYEGQVFYARIVKCRWRTGRNEYYVHYNGWSNSHDEWMPENVLSPLLPAECTRPEELLNPQPSRSSKSNHIIGEPAPTHTSANTTSKEAKAVRRRVPKSLPSDEEGDDDGGDEDDGTASDSSTVRSPSVAYVPRSLSRQAKENERSTRNLKVRLRHRDRRVQEQPSATTDSLYGAPSFLNLQLEMDRLEMDRFLEYQPPRRPKLLRDDNLHRHSSSKTVGPFRRALLTMVDLRVPRLEDLVGVAPVTKVSGGSRQIRAEHVTEKMLVPEKTDGIRSMEHELRHIRREYQKKKKMLRLYYGSSESGSGDSKSSSPEILTTRPSRKARNVE